MSEVSEAVVGLLGGSGCVLLSSSILRETSIDGTGWSPARRLKVKGVLNHDVTNVALPNILGCGFWTELSLHSECAG